MKSVFKKALALLCAVCLLLTFAACSGNSDKTDEQTLVIGGSGPLTGDNSAYGTAVQKGAQIAVDEINEAGGVNGIKLKLEMHDDEADPTIASKNFATLMDKGMKASIGCVTSGAMASFADEAADTGMLVITPSASAAECITHDNAFRICFSDPEQGAYAAQFISENKLGTKVAIIYDASDNYSKGLHDAFIEKAAELKLNIVADKSFTKDTNIAFDAQIRAAKDGGADLIFLPIYYTQAAGIISQSKGVLDDSVKFVGCDGLDGILSVVEDASIVEGITLLTPFFADSTDETVSSFVAAYKAKYDNEVPNQFAADAYDAVYAIKAAMEKAGITDVNDSELGAKMVAAMTEIEVIGTTGTMTWSADGASSKAAAAVVVNSGKYVEYKK